MFDPAWNYKSCSIAEITSAIFFGFHIELSFSKKHKKLKRQKIFLLKSYLLDFGHLLDDADCIGIN